MIKAGSLFYSIVFSLIISAITCSIIVSASLSRMHAETVKIDYLLSLNAISGLNLLQSRQSLVEPNHCKLIDLFDKGTDSVYLWLQPWGAYEIAISKAVFKNREITRIAQLGKACTDTADNYSIYLADEDKPLSLCGNTLIKGKAYLPKAGVKRAYIEGLSFTRSILVAGEIVLSARVFPSFNKFITNQTELAFSGKPFIENDSIIEIENELPDTISNSFRNKTLIYKSTAPVNIVNGVYAGNIIILSLKQVNIAASVALNNILIYAPKVTVERGFRGNIQAFASDSIIIEKDVTLTYPSAIGLVARDSGSSNAVILLGENDTIAGAVFACKSKVNVLQRVGVVVQEKAVVTGQVYSNGFVDLKGTIYGSLICNKIMLSTPSSVYENHLLNAIIDRTRLPEMFTGINLNDKPSTKRIARWLN